MKSLSSSGSPWRTGSAVAASARGPSSRSSSSSSSSQQQQQPILSSSHKYHKEKSYLISSSRLTAASLLSTAATASHHASASVSPQYLGPEGSGGGASILHEAVAAAASVSSSPVSTSPHSSNQIHLLSNAQLHQHHFSGHDNGPILYDNLNRTSAIDDIRSVVIYIFIATIFFSFFLILPGIRNEKFPTFLCITTSLLVTSIIIISLNGTTWHVGEAPISAPYKAFSRDRIQGDLSVRIGLQSVNISLQAHKYYILHSTDGPMIMENTHKYSLLQQPLMIVMAPVPTTMSSAHSQHDSSINSNGSLTPSSLSDHSRDEHHQTLSAAASDFIHHHQEQQTSSTSGKQEAKQNLAEELLAGRTSDSGVSVDTELEAEEPFSTAGSSATTNQQQQQQQQQPSVITHQDEGTPIVSTRRLVRSSQNEQKNSTHARQKRQTQSEKANETTRTTQNSKPKYTIKRVYVDINYNERFYMIGPMQMRREYQQALERGLPYPILTVVEYLSQDDAGFSWSRKYRAAGYYTTMMLWVSASVSLLMFCLHCAAPKYGIYSMQALGFIMLLTNLNYTYLVPTGDQRLVIPFEGQSLTFRYGWNFWLNLIGGCLALAVGTIFVLIDRLFPNFIFTTVLDVDYDSTCQKTHYERKYKIMGRRRRRRGISDESGDEDNESDLNSTSNASSPSSSRPMSSQDFHERRPKMPPFMRHELKKRRSQGRDAATAINREDHVSRRDVVGHLLEDEGHLADGDIRQRPLHIVRSGSSKRSSENNERQNMDSYSVVSHEQTRANDSTTMQLSTGNRRQPLAAAQVAGADVAIEQDASTQEPSSSIERRRGIVPSTRDHNKAEQPRQTVRL